MPTVANREYCFDVFRFDAATGELYRNGHALRIPEQAARILAFLLERAGTVVTREELRQLLWPEGEHLDYDHSISNSISRLRAILRDDLRSPAYIATISKRGYKFIAAVETLIPEAVEPEPTAVPPEAAARKSRAFSRPVLLAAGAAALLLISIVVWAVRRGQTPQTAPDLYLAVAPFDVASGDRTLADSFRLDLADSLSLLPGVKVTAAHSFPDGRPDDASIRRLGADTHLDVLLLGSFHQQDRACSLNFELVRASDAVHLGSFHYSGTVDELSSIRNRIQEEVFSRLDLVRYATRPAQAPATNPRAYELYLRARYDLLQQNKESLNRAIEGFSAATAIDPHFAKAYSGMANVYVTLADHDDVPMQEGYRKAMELARKSVAMDPQLAEGHALLGYASLGPNWDLAFAELELRKAVELDPNSARFHLWLAVLLGEQARFTEAYHHIDLAYAADPLWPAIMITEAFIASAARDNARMIDTADKLVRLKPDWPLAYEQLGWVYWYSGQHQRAAEQWLRMAEMDQDPQRIQLERDGIEALRHGGPVAFSRLRTQAIQSGAAWKHPYHDFFPAEWHACAGYREAALNELEKIVNQRAVGSLVIAVNPFYDALRTDPRFVQLLDRIYGPAVSTQVQQRLAGRLKENGVLNLACPMAPSHN